MKQSPVMLGLFKINHEIRIPFLNNQDSIESIRPGFFAWLYWILGFLDLNGGVVRGGRREKKKGTTLSVFHLPRWKSGFVLNENVLI